MSSHLALNKKYWAKDSRKDGVEFHDLTTNPHDCVKKTGPLTDAEIQAELTKLVKEEKKQ